MKTNKQGFTLIELLTVIAIIGILAGIIIPAVGSVRKSAKIAKTQAMFSQWTTAIEQFRQEYGYYPTPENENADYFNLNNAKHRKEFFRVVGGIDTATEPEKTLNYKGIPFYSFSGNELLNPSADLDDNPEVVDTFGNQEIRIAVDKDRDGVIPAEDVEIGNFDVRNSIIIYTIPDDKEGFPIIRTWDAPLTSN